MLLFPSVFDGTSWDNLDGSVLFYAGFRPQAAIDKEGRILICWYDARYNRVMYATRTVDGAWSDAQELSDFPCTYAASVTLNMNEIGSAVASWQTDDGTTVLATYAWGDSSWVAVRTEEQGVINRAFVNANGDVVSSWWDQTRTRLARGVIGNPLQVVIDGPEPIAFVDSFNDAGVASIFTNDGSFNAYSFNASTGVISEAQNLGTASQTLFQPGQDVHSVGNAGGQWLALWVSENSNEYSFGYKDTSSDWSAEWTHSGWLPEGYFQYPMFPHALDLNASGQGAAIYMNQEQFLVISLYDPNEGWIRQELGEYLPNARSLQIGINDNGQVLAVWSDSVDNSLYYAQAEFGGEWTVKHVEKSLFVQIQAFDSNNLGEAVMFRRILATSELIPCVFDGTSWDNLNGSLHFFGTEPQAAINDVGNIFVCWVDQNTYFPLFATRSVAGEWSDPAAISSIQVFSKAAFTLSLNENNQAVVSWVDENEKMHIATFTVGDSAWVVTSQDEAAILGMNRALINDSGTIVSSWFDGTNVRLAKGEIKTPFQQVMTGPALPGYLAALNFEGVGGLLLTDEVNSIEVPNVYGATFDSLNQTVSDPVLLFGDPAWIFTDRTSAFAYAVTNDQRDWYAFWASRGGKSLEVSYGASTEPPPPPPPVTLSASGEQVTVQYATCREYVNRLSWSAESTVSLPKFNLYRDGTLIKVVIAGQEPLRYDDREQKKDLPHLYKVEAIDAAGEVVATTNIVVP